MRKMKICFIAEGYPTPEDPIMPFLKELIKALVIQGVECVVIAPQSATRSLGHRVPLRPRHWFDNVEGNRRIEVYQPVYFTLSNLSKQLNAKLFLMACKRAYNQIAESVDVLYGHFWHMGVVASKLDKEKPLFVACGESLIAVTTLYSNQDIQEMRKRLAGVIYVSKKCLDESIELGLQSLTPYIIAPNGFNKDEFFCKDQIKARKLLSWPHDDFVVAFVGAFIERKGVLRVAEALSRLNNPRISVCFIGAGEQNPTCNNIIFCDKVPHDKLVNYLCASDVFVLPTQNEGCCNAIIEALACGLPVVSSNLPFNDDVLDDTCSIKIDPDNIEEIAKAIQELLDNPEKRKKMASGALQKAKNLSIHSRARNILNFIDKNRKK